MTHKLIPNFAPSAVNDMKTKFDYCHFVDGTVEEIQSWHQFGQDLVFFTESGVYLFKYREFIDDIMEAEFRRTFGRSRGIFLVHYCFYKYRGRICSANLYI